LRTPRSPACRACSFWLQWLIGIPSVSGLSQNRATIWQICSGVNVRPMVPRPITGDASYPPSCDRSPVAGQSSLIDPKPGCGEQNDPGPFRQLAGIRLPLLGSGGLLASLPNSRVGSETAEFKFERGKQDSIRRAEPGRLFRQHEIASSSLVVPWAATSNVRSNCGGDRPDKSAVRWRSLRDGTTRTRPSPGRSSGIPLHRCLGQTIHFSSEEASSCARTGTRTKSTS
jgi:hypothetical protein